MENKFNVGDRVSWSVGSDRYVGTVERVTPARVHVKPTDYGVTLTFTLRQNGSFRMMGWDSTGALRLGGEAYYDPSF